MFLIGPSASNSTCINFIKSVNHCHCYFKLLENVQNRNKTLIIYFLLLFMLKAYYLVLIFSSLSVTTNNISNYIIWHILHINTYLLIFNCLHIIQLVGGIGYINDTYLKNVKNSFYLSRIFFRQCVIVLDFIK